MSVQSSIPKDIRDARGYEPVGGSGGNTDAWHRTTDTLEHADPDVLLRDTRVYLVVLSRLLRDEVIPLDHRRTVRRHREIVSEYDEVAGEHFDLAPVLEAIDELDEAVDEFYDAVSAGAVGAGEANEAIKALSRRLVAIDFTSDGRFEQDPGMYRPPYPLLEPASRLPAISGDEYRQWRTHLRRGRNHVIYQLREARRALP